MQQVIDGLLYDTAEADLCGEDSWGTPTDFHYWAERLYKTRNDRWFLHGTGGASSKWAEAHAGGTFTGGERLEALTEDQAREWGERHMRVTEYARTFGVPDSA